MSTPLALDAGLDSVTGLGVLLLDVCFDDVDLPPLEPVFLLPELDEDVPPA